MTRPSVLSRGARLHEGSQTDITLFFLQERLGLGPAIVHARNPHIIYARMTGFGQTGKYSSMAGHDMNYVATSGLLSALGHPSGPPATSLNLIGDFAGGGLMMAFGITMALMERDNKRTGSGKGQVIDCAMVRCVGARDQMDSPGCLLTDLSLHSVRRRSLRRHIPVPNALFGRLGPTGHQFRRLRRTVVPIVRNSRREIHVCAGAGTAILRDAAAASWAPRGDAQDAE